MKYHRVAPKHVKPHNTKGKGIKPASKPKPAKTQKLSRLTKRLTQ